MHGIKTFNFIALGALALTSSLFAADTTAAKSVTFHKDVEPIFQEKCQDCHRKGSMAPMSLVTYEETRPWAKSIRQRVASRQMPPWHMDRTVGIQKFLNDRSLSDEQVATIVAWVDAGAPAGEAKDAPVAKVWDDSNAWKLKAQGYGEPDMVISTPNYTVPKVGQDQWYKPYSDIPVTEERWVRAVEMRPSSVAGRRITHHVLAYLLQNEGTDADAPRQNQGLLMEWAVGKSFDIYRANAGKLLLPGSKIWWEIHTHSVGEDITTNTELGIWFYPKDQKPQYRTRLGIFGATEKTSARLDIAPNTMQVTQDFHVLPRPARLENFQPHMHLRGKAMSVEAILPDGTTQMISYVNNFNFNWMTNYIYADDAAPVLPKGTILHITAWHDNTRANPNNPDPDQWVGWGDRTVDEMAHAWINVTYITDDDYKAWEAAHKKASPRGFTANQQ
jgi:hypothetical protein